MFNKLATTLAATAILISGLGAAPAQARSTVCAAGDAGETLHRFRCNVSRRINANGHIVWDISSRYVNGVVVLWTDGSGEFISKGKVNDNFEVRDEGNGVIRMINRHNDFNFMFKV